MKINKWLEKFDYMYGVLSIVIGLIYFAFTIVMVFGIPETNMDRLQNIVFATIGAAIGVAMMFLSRLQGKTLGEKTDEAMIVNKEYNSLLNKTKPTKKLKSFESYMFKATIMDILTKGIIIASSAYGIMEYIYMIGTGDVLLIGQALANLAIFTLFSLKAMLDAYNRYTTEHIEVIKIRIERLKEEVANNEGSK